MQSLQQKEREKEGMELDNNVSKRVSSSCSVLKERKVSDIMMAEEKKRKRLVQVPYTASVADTIHALVANDVAAVPVAAPPGHWLGAGGSMIMESDKTTGAVRKHYIGIVTMLDVLIHIAEADTYGGDLDKLLSIPVSSIIGHCLEGLSLWTLNPNTNILDAMEVFSKGIHRALVPVDSHVENVVGVELVDASPGYRMLTQMDVLRYLKAQCTELKDIMSSTVVELGAINENVYSVTQHTKAIEAIKCMKAASLNSVPIIEASPDSGEDHKLICGKGRRLIGTFSATDLKGGPIAQLQSWLSLPVVEFTKRVSTGPNIECNASTDLGHSSARALITCTAETTLSEVIDKAVAGHVHRVWAVDEQGFLVGLLSLSDILRTVRASLLGQVLSSMAVNISA